MNDSLATVLAEGVRERGADTVFGSARRGPEPRGGRRRPASRAALRARPRRDRRLHHGRHVRPADRSAGDGHRHPWPGCAPARRTARRKRRSTATRCSSSPTACRAVDRDRVGHQRIDQQQLFAPVTKWSGRLAASPRSAEAVRAAIDLAAARPRGAVHLDFDPGRRARWSPPAPPAPTQSTDDVVDAGRGDDRRCCRSRWRSSASTRDRAPCAVRRAAIERLGCPVLTTYQAIGRDPRGPSAARRTVHQRR